jgi:pimeloyl-ACP methyl ester carboxylesterase
MQQRIPNARLVVFPNIGSGIHLLIPDRCTEELLRFLD